MLFRFRRRNCRGDLMRIMHEGRFEPEVGGKGVDLKGKVWSLVNGGNSGLLKPNLLKQQAPRINHLHRCRKTLVRYSDVYPDGPFFNETTISAWFLALTWIKHRWSRWLLWSQRSQEMGKVQRSVEPIGGRFHNYFPFLPDWIMVLQRNFWSRMKRCSSTCGLARAACPFELQNHWRIWLESPPWWSIRIRF